MADGTDSENVDPRPEAVIGAAMRAARKAQDISLRDFARKLHYAAHSNLVEYELGHRMAPLGVVEAYEEGLNLAPGSLTNLYEQLTADAELSARSAAETSTPPSAAASTEARPPPPREEIDCPADTPRPAQPEDAAVLPGKRPLTPSAFVPADEVPKEVPVSAGRQEGKRRRWVICVGVAIVAAGVAMTIMRRGDVDRCSDLGYRSLVGERGETFATRDGCAQFVKRGGRFAATGFYIPAGATATFTDVTLSSCNDLTWGYEINLTERTDAAGKTDTCVDLESRRDLRPLRQPDETIGPFPTAVVVRAYLRDNTCSLTFFSDGSHARSTGSNPYRIGIADAGGGCAGADAPRKASNLGLVLHV